MMIFSKSLAWAAAFASAALLDPAAAFRSVVYIDE
jgi:hypothetical protein